MRFRIYPYRTGSRSARALSEGLGARVLRREGSRFTPRPEDVIINWGASACPIPVTYNQPQAVRSASNKASAFTLLAEANVSIPRFATTRDNISWEGKTVVRHVLNGHSGEGIEIFEPNTELPDAPLYVEYIPKQDEYRVHVVGTSIIACQRKARDRDVENPNWQVRNHANGFVFVREGFTCPESVSQLAVQAVQALGLDFGAVDIIYNQKRQAGYVLEVNCAPGLEGRTIDDYVEAFRNLIGEEE
jgi:glutathione synthase/RimK-type ligase-like ATP-grasp enzyme